MTKEQPITRQARNNPDAEIRAINEETRTVSVIASTEIVDSYGTIIKQNGWDFTRFLKNPVVQLSHDWEGLPIGKVTRINVINDKLDVEIQFAPEEANPMAERVWQLWRLGFLRAVSVGFLPKKYHWEEREAGKIMVFDEAELLEISVVAIPANAEALAKSLVRSVRSTKAETRSAGETAIRAMAEIVRSFSEISAGAIDETDPDELPGTEPEEEEDNVRVMLKAYRKLIPSLRAHFGVDKMENEDDQVKAIRAAIDEAEPEAKPATDETPTVEEPGEAEAKPEAEEPADEPADEPVKEETPADPGNDESEPESDEPEADNEDIEAIEQQVAEKLAADNS